MSSLSRTTSIIKSASFIRLISSSRFPVFINLTLSLCIRGVGLPVLTGFNILLTAVSATILRLVASLGTMSNKVTGRPEFAMCAAIPLPIKPAPITATLLISI